MEKIGFGSFSNVYKGEKDGKFYAIKEISKDKLFDETYLLKYL